MGSTRQDAYCTLLTSDEYLPGAMVLGHSLKDNGTTKQLAALVTLDSVTAAAIDELRTVYDHVIPVDRIVNHHPANLYLMDRPDLSSAFTKIVVWRQIQFRRIVYLDADVVAVRAPDELFDRDSTFAAAPDVGWPDCFNSGVMALTPNMGDYYGLLALAQRGISFDGADQGLLNMHFPKWDRFSFAYNCTPSAHYQYVPAYRHFQSSISLLHFIGREKPWTQGRERKGGTSVYDELLGRWWAVYDKHYKAPSMAYISGQGRPVSRAVQQHVQGEAHTADYGLSFAPPVPTAPQHDQHHDHQPENQHHSQPEPPPAAPEVPLMDQADLAEQLDTGEAQPVPTAEQRRFSAPMAEWNPEREPPPAQSRPEAVNFPTEQYTMSEDSELFKPPKSYPEPPKDMWYEVPKTPPAAEKPKPIFPWEVNQEKATRIFPEDKPTPPETPPLQVDTSTTEGEAPNTPPTPTVKITPTDESAPFSSFSRTNAWDDDPAISRYVSMMNLGGRLARVQVIQRDQPTTGVSAATTTATADASTAGAATQKERRRPTSIKLTDFPTDMERPSLPVTPAPIQRPQFWGGSEEETRSTGGSGGSATTGGAAGSGTNGVLQYPPAEGVPKQEDWDPLKKLEELQRRQSEILELTAGGGAGAQEAAAAGGAGKELPERELVESAVLVPTSEETEMPMTSSQKRAGYCNGSCPEHCPV